MESLLLNAPLHYPKAKEWMWDYCIYLGPFTDSKGKNYDLGVHISHRKDTNSNPLVSAAIVVDNEPGRYYSGNLHIFGEEEECYVETKRRAIELGLFKQVKPTTL